MVYAAAKLCLDMYLLRQRRIPGQGAWTCNSVTTEEEFGNGVGSKTIEGKSLSLGGWVVWSLVIQHKERVLINIGTLLGPNIERRFQAGLS